MAKSLQCTSTSVKTCANPFDSIKTMIRRIYKYLEKKEHDWRKSFGRDIEDPVERRKSFQHLRWLDHGILRTFWHNFEEIAPGVYRSNQPDPKRFEAYAKQGFKTILNLRGETPQSYYLFEQESCAKLGMKLISVHLSARQAPRVVRLKRLMKTFETMEKPVLIHCKSGADRTGLAAALYLMLHHGAPVAEAKKQLSFRFLHIRRSKTGILDHFFDVYAARNESAPIKIDSWIKEEYRRRALTRSFNQKRKKQWFWQGW